MRAIVDAKAFSEVLGNVGKVIQKSAIPVLEGVLVRFKNGRCFPDCLGFYHLADGGPARPGRGICLCASKAPGGTPMLQRPPTR